MRIPATVFAFAINRKLFHFGEDANTSKKDLLTSRGGRKMARNLSEIAHDEAEAR